MGEAVELSVIRVSLTRELSDIGISVLAGFGRRYPHFARNFLRPLVVFPRAIRRAMRQRYRRPALTAVDTDVNYGRGSPRLESSVDLLVLLALLV
jgi:hypothetical protein